MSLRVRTPHNLRFRALMLPVAHSCLFPSALTQSLALQIEDVIDEIGFRSFHWVLFVIMLLGWLAGELSGRFSVSPTLARRQYRARGDDVRAERRFPSGGVFFFYSSDYYLIILFYFFSLFLSFSFSQ